MLPIEILIASGNRNKIMEFQTILKDYPVNIVSPSDLINQRALSSPPEVEENESTYLGNARLKAIAYYNWSGMAVLADDSGLEVEALGDRPGLFSARYAGEGADDDAKMNKVLSELAELENVTDSVVTRRARFRCALVFIDKFGVEYHQESVMEGEILREKVGGGGFGYDPIVKINALGRTLAELEFEQTCKIGFRAEATLNLFDKILSKD